MTSERGKFMFKKKKNLLPTAIANYFEISSRPVIGQKSIQNEGEIFWRELPQYLKDINSSVTFKKFYKAHLLGTN